MNPPSAPAEVVRVEVRRRELPPQGREALRALFGLEALPLAPATVEIEVRGVPTAVVNALRRAVTDEMPGRALQVPPDGFDVAATTDAFMLPQFVNGRIGLVPLRAQIPPRVAAALRFDLDYTNTTAAVVSVYTGDLVVAAGELPEPIFNPTFELAALQPGKRLVVRGIRIVTGRGRDNAAFMVARRAEHRHLDLGEEPEAETHEAGGRAAEASGYRTSCLVADPRHHLLTAVLPAAAPSPAEARSVFADACAHVQERLRLVASAVELAPGARGAHGAQYTVVDLGGGLSEGLLHIPGETHTVGELLRRAVYDRDPRIASVSYTVVPHEGRLAFSLRHTEDVTRLLRAAVADALAALEALRRGIEGP